MLNAFKKSKKGFTLVELMVVVVIIGILTAIAIPVFNNVTGNAEKKSCHANLRTIDGMKQQWNMMTDDERDDVGGFGDMFQGGEVPECPKGGTYSDADETAAEADTQVQASCSEHGTY
jgi:type IV pilus assembly protein PilA